MSIDLKSELGSTISDYNGYVCHTFDFDGREAKIAEPKTALQGRPWIWRIMFWDAFNSADLALLGRGFHVGYVDTGDTFANAAAIALLDSFYARVTGQLGLSKRPALEGLSRGGFASYRWAYFNPDKVGCLYADAPLCDINIIKRHGDDPSMISDFWRKVCDAYGHTDWTQPLSIEGNAVADATLSILAKAGIPIIHVCGSEDDAATNFNNNDVVQAKYPALGGEFVLIMKEGCGHHPHGLTDPTLVVDYIVGKCAEGPAAVEARARAPRGGSVITMPPGTW